MQLGLNYSGTVGHGIASPICEMSRGRLWCGEVCLIYVLAAAASKHDDII